MLFSLRKFHLSVHIHVLNFVHMFLFDCLSPFYVLCHVCSSFMKEIKNTTYPRDLFGSVFVIVNASRFIWKPGKYTCRDFKLNRHFAFPKIISYYPLKM